VMAPATVAATGSADRASGSADRSKPGRAPSDADKWFDGINGNSFTSYKEMNPASGTLHVQAAQGVQAAANVPVDVAAGKLYTLVILGSGSDGTLDVLKIEDSLVP
jgi:hypothetical protein